MEIFYIMSYEFRVPNLFENKSISDKIYDIVYDKTILEIGGPSPNNYWIHKFYDFAKYVDIINFIDENNISLNFGCGGSYSYHKIRKFIKVNFENNDEEELFYNNFNDK